MTRLSLPRAGTGRRLRHRDEKGAALVEFALVISLFAFILYGLISFGMILATKQRVTSASAEAARSAVGSTTGAAAEATARTRLESILGAPGSYTATYDTDACPAVPEGPKCIKVTVTWDYKNHPIVPPAPGLGIVTPDSFGSSAIVQYQ